MKRISRNLLSLALSLTCAASLWAQGPMVQGVSHTVSGHTVASGGPGCDDCNSCTTGACPTPNCSHKHCPYLYHCQEGPLRITFHVGCPKPVCNPCTLPNFGYFETCWSPWKAGPDWSHCREMPPAATVQLPVPGTPGAGPYGAMPPVQAVPVQTVPMQIPTTPLQPMTQHQTQTEMMNPYAYNMPQRARN